MRDVQSQQRLTAQHNGAVYKRLLDLEIVVAIWAGEKLQQYICDVGSSYCIMTCKQMQA